DKNTNAPMTKTIDFQLLGFGHFIIWYSDLFRVSDFDIRILKTVIFVSMLTNKEVGYHENSNLQ
ncbi:MAG: hypothetical protein KAT52_09145, partial [Desulfobacterales bacterium]|nr:hypothetical protein [Desulfobacterales bacterium]